jgi:hypothetical protein
MAPVLLNEGSGAGKDPSKPAFWLPFQDITTHNHTPQWTQQVATMTPMGMCIATGGNCMQNPAACCGGSSCNYMGTCLQIIQ